MRVSAMRRQLGRLTPTRPLRAAGRVLAVGTLACVLTGLSAPTPAWANFQACNLTPVAPCETVNSAHRMVYWVHPYLNDNTLFIVKGHLQVWSQDPNGPVVSIWNSPTMSFWPGYYQLFPKLYLNTAYPQNARVCTRMWINSGSSFINDGSSCANITY